MPSPNNAAAGVACATLLLGCAMPTEPRARPRPNIVFILADDMGYGDPRCNNPDSRIHTPHIDRLAREGMRFTDAHAPASVCVPSRYGLLTGRYPCRSRSFRPRKQAVIRPDQTTIASMLRAHGYHTAMVGKWHLGFDGGPDLDWSAPLRGGPVDRGFDRYFGIPASLDIPPYYFIRDRTPLAAPTGRIDASATAGWTNIQGAFWRAGGNAPGFAHQDVLPRFSHEATTYLDERGQDSDAAPFFLYVALTAPHTPWLPAPEFRGRSGASMYGDFVMQVDATVGEILTALDRNQLTQDTLVVFSSDNGPVWYPTDVARFAHASVGPLRGMKGDAWEGGHRVPFVARWPAQIEAESVSAQTICFTDVMATLADVAAIQMPANAGEDSESFAPVLRGATAQSTRQTTVLKANGSVIRHGKWKLITHLGSGGFSQPRRREPNANEPPGQLYDLDRDLAETTNLWHQHPDIVARLHELLADVTGRAANPR